MAELTFQSLGKQKKSAFFALSFSLVKTAFNYDVKVAGVSPKSNVTMIYVGITINLEKLYESAASYVSPN